MEQGEGLRCAGRGRTAAGGYALDAQDVRRAALSK